MQVCLLLMEGSEEEFCESVGINYKNVRLSSKKRRLLNNNKINAIWDSEKKNKKKFIEYLPQNILCKYRNGI